MDRNTCYRFAYLTSLMTLPSLILALMLVSANASIDSGFLSFLASIFIWITILSYASSVVLTIVSGFLAKSRWILFPPVLALLDIVLFLMFLPQDETAVGWRAIDVILLGGLVILNIAQVVILKKHIMRTKVGLN